MNPPSRILFFADAGPEVGGGHVMRCLTLARALVERGCECAFVESRAAAPILRRFGWPPHSLLAMIGSEKLADLIVYADSFAGLFEPDVVVIDHYRVEATQETGLRRETRRIVVIDDLANRPHDCDLVIDPGYGRKAEAYGKLAPASASVRVGPAYALVRPQFAAARARALSRRAKHGPVARALISLGMTDVGAITQRVVEALSPALGEVRVDIVLGSDAPSLPALTARAKEDRRLKLWIDNAEMASLMADADIAIGAGGSSVWERAVVGLPGATLALAENQREMVAQMSEAGLTIGLDAGRADFVRRLGEAWGRLVGDAELRWRLAQRNADLCDGHGAARVADAIISL